VPYDHYLLPDGSYGDAETAKSLWTERRRAEAEAALAGLLVPATRCSRLLGHRAGHPAHDQGSNRTL